MTHLDEAAQPPPPKLCSDMKLYVALARDVRFGLFFFFYLVRGDLLLTATLSLTSISLAVFLTCVLPLCSSSEPSASLPHLLIIPFLVSRRMWQTGMVDPFRQCHPCLRSGGNFSSGSHRVRRAGGKPMRQFGAVACGHFLRRQSQLDLFAKHRDDRAALPCLFYLGGRSSRRICFQVTMVDRWWKCGACLLGACLTRYDGWFLAAVLVFGSIAVYLHFASSGEDAKPGARDLPSRAQILKFTLIAAAAQILWLAYNAIVYRNPLEFANGPYSAKSIEQKTATVNPAKDNLLAAGSYFLKAAQLNVAQSTWMGRIWLGLALLGTLISWFQRRGRVALLLWTPMPFLRPIDSLWKRSHLRAHVVAVFKI